MIIEDRLLEPQIMKWQDAKMSKLHWYIANVDPQCWPQYKEKMSERIQSRLTTPCWLQYSEKMSESMQSRLGSRRALNTFFGLSHTI